MDITDLPLIRPLIRPQNVAYACVRVLGLQPATLTLLDDLGSTIRAWLAALPRPRVPPSHAMNGPDGWYRCHVEKAGPAADTGHTYVQLREVDGAFNDWYTARPGMAQEILATALTAVRAGRTVLVRLRTTASHGTIDRIYINAGASADSGPGPAADAEPDGDTAADADADAQGRPPGGTRTG